MSENQKPIIPFAGRDPQPHAVVVGAGIAGLTAAHELSDRGFTVTVYEPEGDERKRWKQQRDTPGVKVGGLAASQYAPVDDDPQAPFEPRLRTFPQRPRPPKRPAAPVPGEHGFRFFPAYYLHLFDTLRRIPVYERDETATDPRWRPTSRSVYDNLNRVVTQAVATQPGIPSLIFPRQSPKSLAEMMTATEHVKDVGFTAKDIMLFSGQMMRYLTISPIRRRDLLEHMSAYDFFKGRDQPGPDVEYSPAFEHMIEDMPKVLAAFDAKWGDARTNITTYLQLQFHNDDAENKADGVLKGPTTDAWFDHWHQLLVNAGVTFVNQAVTSIRPPAGQAGVAPHLRNGATVVLANGDEVSPDYIVVAVDNVAAEAITKELRSVPSAGTIARLDGWASSSPPDEGPKTPAAHRTTKRRDPHRMDQMGEKPWDRLQTLTGIQYFFDTEVQLVRGHIYFTGSEWGLSSINQQGLWDRRPTLAQDGYVSVLSVDVGDWNRPAAPGSPMEGKRARDCTPDEIALEVWHQVGRALTNNHPEGMADPLPMPAWFTIDRNIIFGTNPDGTEGVAERNEAPYLVPIISDWDNRPGGFPWNPNANSPSWVPSEENWESLVSDYDTWQARHGGYQVHHNSIVFAGTWTKTFTRMTSMEAANESARHAVNAILDHAIWTSTEGVDKRSEQAEVWSVPFGFTDQSSSVSVRVPTALGDYCLIFDIENREPYEFRKLRTDDGEAHLAARNGGTP